MAAPKGLSFDNIPDEQHSGGLSFDAVPAEEQGPPIPAAVPLTAEGLAKAGGTGVVKGGLGMADMVIQGNPVTLALRNAGIITPANMQAAFEAITGPLHKPESRAERFAETAGEFLPGAVAGGGGIARTAANLAKGAVAGLATEGAGQAAEAAGASPGVEKAIRIATAVAAPLGLNKGNIGKKPEAPTREELAVERKGNYKTMETSGDERAGNAVGKMATDIMADIGPGSHVTAPKSHALLNELADVPIAPGARVSVPIAALDKARSRLRSIAKDAVNPLNPNMEEYRAATLAANRIDDFIASPTAATVSGPGGMAAARVAAQALEEGRGNAGAEIRSELLASQKRNAEIQNATNQNSNYAGVLKKKVDDLLVENRRGVSMGEREGFNPEELASVEKFINSGKVSKVAAEWLKTTPLAGELLSKLARTGQGALANRALDAIDEAVRMRSPLYSKKLASLPPNIARDLINALAPSMGAIPNQ